MAEPKERPPLATPEDYAATFEGFKPGEKVLQHLSAMFYDQPSFAPGGIEGQRETERRAAHKEVIAFILRKIGQIGADHNAD